MQTAEALGAEVESLTSRLQPARKKLAEANETCNKAKEKLAKATLRALELLKPSRSTP
jgi:hypothetical protein